MAVEYKVVVKKVSSLVWRDVDKAARDLASLVNSELAAGWNVQGGVASVETGTSVCLIQALIRRKK
jgi:hypothetical protein